MDSSAHKAAAPSVAFFEFHHVVPFAEGGPTVAENLSLRCRRHNQHEAERWFGPPMVREAPSNLQTRSGPS